MLKPLALLLVCQLAGEAITRGLALPLPGPVVGLLILLVALFIARRRGRIDASTVDSTSLGAVSNGLLASLGVLFVPAGVGVIQHLHLLGRQGPALFVILLLSTVLTLIVTVWVFVAVLRLVERRR
jgi:holin-like protein